MRKFESGATRDSEEGKFDLEGFVSPIVLHGFAEYMHRHRVQADGGLRDSDNWQKGMTLECYMKSGHRHFMDWWLEHRGFKSREGLLDALYGLMFNLNGYIFETLKHAKLELDGTNTRGKAESLHAVPGAPDKLRLRKRVRAKPKRRVRS